MYIPTRLHRFQLQPNTPWSEGDAEFFRARKRPSNYTIAQRLHPAHWPLHFRAATGVHVPAAHILSQRIARQCHFPLK